MSSLAETPAEGKLFFDAKCLIGCQNRPRRGSQGPLVRFQRFVTSGTGGAPCPGPLRHPPDCTARSGAQARRPWVTRGALRRAGPVARTMSFFGRNDCCTSKAQFGSVRSATRLAREFARATGPLIPGRATGPALLSASRAGPGVRSSCERSPRSAAPPPRSRGRWGPPARLHCALRRSGARTPESDLLANDLCALRRAPWVTRDASHFCHFWHWGCPVSGTAASPARLHRAPEASRADPGVRSSCERSRRSAAPRPRSRGRWCPPARRHRRRATGRRTGSHPRGRVRSDPPALPRR